VQQTTAGTKTAPTDASVMIGVGPVTIPDYLDRPQIVVRSSHNGLLVSEFNRWAGSLQNDTGRVVRENLDVLLARDDLSVTSWRRGIPSVYRVSVDVSRFEAIDEKIVVLRAQWAIFGGDGARVLLVHDSDIREEVRGGGIEQVVAAMGRALESLSREVAQGVRGVKAAVPVKADGKTG
ncbi:MAG TPA: PqiC family protein, partial [Geobacteraceae bacterium]|nr:PqiC family protein [Geobacteraceae bacterium]